MLEREYPNRDCEVSPGDCNERIPEALEALRPIRNAPAFAFLDPDGMELAWTTIEALARHRPGDRRVELWMLFTPSGVMRTFQAGEELREEDVTRANKVFGTDRWIPFVKARHRGQISAESARSELVNLMRWRLQVELGYRWSHPLELYNLKNVPLYTMIFATANEAGNSIMEDLYAKAQRTAPRMREDALERRRVERTGQFALFPPSAVEDDAVIPYEYAEPWDPDTFEPS